MTLYPTYMYLSQPLFILWITGSVLCSPQLWHSFLTAQQYAFLGASAVDLEMGSHLVITLAIVMGPRAVHGRSLAAAASALMEVLTSLLLCLNSILFDSFAVLEFLVVRKKGREWVSMRKGDSRPVALPSVIRKLWPSALLGVVGLVLGFLYASRWALIAAPFLVGFLLSIPLAYWTGKPIRGELGREA